MCYAESLLQWVFLAILQDEKLVTLIKSSLKLRECYKCYRYYLNNVISVASTTNLLKICQILSVARVVEFFYAIKSLMRVLLTQMHVFGIGENVQFIDECITVSGVPETLSKREDCWLLLCGCVPTRLCGHCYHNCVANKSARLL